MTEVTVQPTDYLVTVMPVDHPNASSWSLNVSWRGNDRWAVRRHSMCLSRSGGWSYEQVPSEREDEWIAEHRFDLDEALRLARERAPHVVVNGKTATEILELMRERGDYQ